MVTSLSPGQQCVDLINLQAADLEARGRALLQLESEAGMMIKMIPRIYTHPTLGISPPIRHNYYNSSLFVTYLLI